MTLAWTPQNINDKFRALVRPVSEWSKRDGIMFITGGWSNDVPRPEEPVVFGISVDGPDRFVWTFPTVQHAKSFIRLFIDSERSSLDSAYRAVEMADGTDDVEEKKRFLLAALYQWGRILATAGAASEVRRAENNMAHIRRTLARVR